MSNRRPALKLQTFDAVIADIRSLRDNGYTPAGNWNLAQTCHHLTMTMRVGLDGDAPRAHWLMRKIFGLMLNFVLWRRSMPAGVKTIPTLEPPELAEDDPQLIELCLATLAESRGFPGPLPPYPLADGMTLDKWKRLQVVHAQHHLSFLAPKSSA